MRGKTNLIERMKDSEATTQEQPIPCSEDK